MKRDISVEIIFINEGTAMKLKYFTLTLVAVGVLSACSIGDDNDAEVSALQAQVEQLQSELDNIDT